MTYFEFLGWFLGIALVLLSILTIRDRQNSRRLPDCLRTWPSAFVIATHVFVAMAYTTPRDNYLVATGVWRYDLQLVTGIVFDWITIR